MTDKRHVRDFWESEACGERYGAEQDRLRYELEPEILPFANFESAAGKKVLEVGVGMGADFLRWVSAGAAATGIDLTERAVTLTRQRLVDEGLQGDVREADAEKLPFEDGEFDIVYSWGVLHHTPDTGRALTEAQRVLAPGGELKIMLYHRISWVAIVAWARFCLLRGTPFRTLRAAVAQIESPGTQAFTRAEVRAMLPSLVNASVRPKLTHWDRRWAPLVSSISGDRFGWFLLVEGRKEPNQQTTRAELSHNRPQIRSQTDVFEMIRDRRISVAPTSTDPKEQVKAFWEAGSCGEVYAQGVDIPSRFAEHSRMRYELEPYIPTFAAFEDGRDKDILEIGVGMGADHLEWAKQSPHSLKGIDLTSRAVEWTTERLRVNGLDADLSVADAENLPFPDDSFDIVYSWGVLHCSPDTQRAFNEVHRVLRPGGEARILIYHARSIVGYLLWLRYGLLAGKPGRSLNDVYESHLESPGTKAYTLREARELAVRFREVEVRTELSFGDLLLGEVGQQHPSRALRLAKRIWPRPLIRAILGSHGLNLMIKARK